MNNDASETAHPAPDPQRDAQEKRFAFWLSPKGFAVLAGLFVVAAFPQVFLGGQTFFFRDFSLFQYPLAFYNRECFWRGEIPLWNPLNECGMPYLAQWNTMVLYPLNLIYYILPVDYGLTLFCLLHQFLAACGMYLLIRYLIPHVFKTTSPDALWLHVCAGLSGVALGFNGLALACLMWPNNIAALGWMPWVMLTTLKSCSHGGRWLAWATLATAMQLLTGAPEFIISTWLVIGVVWLADVIEDRELLRRKSIRLMGQLSLACGLAMPQLLPFLEFLKYSQRSAEFSDASWSMPAWGWANFLVPQFYTFKWDYGVMFQPDQYWTSSYYLGIGVLVLALLATWKIRRPLIWLMALLALLSFILALGTNAFLYPILRKSVPLLGIFRFPVKLIIPAMMVLPLLAGMGLWVLQQESSTGPRKPTRLLFVWGSIVLVLIAAVTSFGCLFPYRDGNVLWSGISRGAVLLGILLVVTALIWRCQPGKAQLTYLALLLPCLVWFDMLTHVPNQNPTVEPWIYFAAQESIRKPAEGERMLTRQDTDYRILESMRNDAPNDVVSKAMSGHGDFNLIAGVAKINGMYSLHVREAFELTLNLYAQSNYATLPLVSFLGSSLIPHPERPYSFTSRTNAMPLVYAGQKPLFLPTNELFFYVLSRTQFDPRKEVVLPLEVQSRITATNFAQAQVKMLRRTAHEIEFEVSTPKATMVTIAQTYYPAWRAWVNNVETPLLRANFAYQALEVPAGTQRIRLKYEAKAFKAGTLFSLFALVTLTSILTASFYRARRAFSRNVSSL